MRPARRLQGVYKATMKKLPILHGDEYSKSASLADRLPDMRLISSFKKRTAAGGACHLTGARPAIIVACASRNFTQ